jgi:hypothetical protein
MAETRKDGRRSKGAGNAGKGGRSQAAAKNGSSRRSSSRMSALDAAGAAREQLSALLGRPVEAVLGAERDGGDWVVKAQVLELARVPNTTDVLGEYEAVIDRGGELVRYARTHRYHRGQVDDER